MNWLRLAYKTNCHSRALRPLVNFGKSINRYYENSNYDFQSNGEKRVLRVLAQFKSPKIVFDVGANKGDWARLALGYFPEAKIHCFEPSPIAFNEIKKIHDGIRLMAYNKALGASEKKLSFFHYASGNELSSFYRFESHKETPSEVLVQVDTGDRFLHEHRMEAVGFLKIDAEGHDLEVLKGFSQHLTAQKIGVIQFEYGKVNIVSKALLRDFYDLLNSLDYLVGKIYPKTVQFRKYNYSLEDFIGPNFIAVRKSETDLIQALS